MVLLSYIVALSLLIHRFVDAKLGSPSTNPRRWLKKRISAAGYSSGGGDDDEEESSAGVGVVVVLIVFTVFLCFVARKCHKCHERRAQRRALSREIRKIETQIRAIKEAETQPLPPSHQTVNNDRPPYNIMQAQKMKMMAKQKNDNSMAQTTTTEMNKSKDAEEAGLDEECPSETQSITGSAKSA